jgi:hypothetical protein
MLTKKSNWDLLTVKIGVKKCKVCRLVLDRVHFHKSKKSKDGVTPICKSCANARGKNERDSLSWNYLAQLLCVKITTKNDELIDLKKRQIEIHRLSKSIKQAVKYSGE